MSRWELEDFALQPSWELWSKAIRPTKFRYLVIYKSEIGSQKTDLIFDLLLKEKQNRTLN